MAFKFYIFTTYIILFFLNYLGQPELYLPNTAGIGKLYCCKNTYVKYVGSDLFLGHFWPLEAFYRYIYLKKCL